MSFQLMDGLVHKYNPAIPQREGAVLENQFWHTYETGWNSCTYSDVLFYISHKDKELFSGKVKEQFKRLQNKFTNSAVIFVKIPFWMRNIHNGDMELIPQFNGEFRFFLPGLREVDCLADWIDCSAKLPILNLFSPGEIAHLKRREWAERLIYYGELNDQDILGLKERFGITEMLPRSAFEQLNRLRSKIRSTAEYSSGCGCCSKKPKLLSRGEIFEEANGLWDTQTGATLLRETILEVIKDALSDADVAYAHYKEIGEYTSFFEKDEIGLLKKEALFNLEERFLLLREFIESL